MVLLGSGNYADFRTRRLSGETDKADSAMLGVSVVEGGVKEMKIF